jgi:hypothetical protein
MRLQDRFPVPIVRRVALCALLAATVPTAVGAPGTSPISLTVEPGFNGFCKANRWLPVTVELQNSGAATEVEVDLRQSFYNNDGIPRSFLRAPLPGATRRRYELYVLPTIYTGSGRLVSQVSRRGEILLRQETSLREITPGERLVVLLNSEEGALSLPSTLGPWNRPGLPSQPRTPLHVASVTPGKAPERWKGYDAVDVLVLGDVSEQSLSVPQQVAIREWVATGGGLVVSGGADAGRLRSRFFQELLPVEVTGTKSMAAAGLPTSVIALARPRPGARILSMGAGPPTVVVGRKGLGRVYFVAFDVTRPPFRGSDAGTRIWSGLLTDVARGDRLLQRADALNLDGSGAYYGGRFSLSQACYELPQLQAPASSGIIFFLLAYIVCLVPVNYAVLRRRDRKEWAWVTTPAIVLVFTLFAYLFGYGTKGGQVRLARVGILEAWSGETTGTMLGYAGLFSPRKTRYEIATETPAVVAPSPEGEGSVKLVHDDGVRIADAAVDMWSMRLFRVESPVALGSGLSVRWVRDGPRVKATITNGTPYDLEDCVYLGRMEGTKVSLTVGTVRRGGSHTVGPVQRGGGHLDLLASSGPEPEGRGSVERMKHALRGAVGQDGQSFGSPLLVGWVRRPLFRMTVDGRQVHEENLTLVVIHLTGGEMRIDD